MLGKKARNGADALAARMLKVAQGNAETAPPQESTDAASRAARTPTFKTATLTFIGGHRLDVVLKDVSATGARVEYVQHTQLPDRVLLTEPTLRLKRWAYVAWQEPGRAGLEFANVEPETPTTR